MNEKTSVPVSNLISGYERKNRLNPIQTILLATDGTFNAENALQNCIGLLKGTDGKLVITYFADPKDTSINNGVYCESNDEWRANGEKILDTLASKARKAGVKEVSTLLEDYQGEESLNQIAETVGANMIMLSSHFFQFGPRNN